MELESKIINCREQITKNNAELKRLTKENERLFNSLMEMMTTLSPKKIERYRKELASDGWKNTDYYKRNIKRFEERNQ